MSLLINSLPHSIDYYDTEITILAVDKPFR